MENIFLGNLPQNESGFRKRQRLHQAFWRAAVLNKEQGLWPRKPNELIGSSINEGKESWANFWPIESLVKKAYDETQKRRSVIESGLFEEERFFNNLLSSQPLAFYAFAIWLSYPEIAAQWLSKLLGEVVTDVEVMFEYSGENHKREIDNSAWDVAFKFNCSGNASYLGLECKYTDTFSPTLYGQYDEKHFAKYHSLFTKYQSHFQVGYDELVSHKKRNQLFRGELIGLQLRRENPELQVWTGLFHHPEDKDGQQAGEEFASLISEGRFLQISYLDYFQQLNELPLPKDLQTWHGCFWARYCSTILSEQWV